MECSRRILVLLALLCGGSAGVEVNPLQKVIQLLSDLEVKIKADGEKEAAAYKAYSEWCTADSREKGYDIKTAKAEIESLTASIAKEQSDGSAALAKIDSLTAGVATDEADLKAATEVREKERADFQAIEADVVESIDVLNRAVNVLERKHTALLQSKINGKSFAEVAQALSVILDAAAVSLHDQKKLTALVQNAANSDDDEPGAPAAAVYESHSGSITDLLEDLREKAATELHEARQQETTARHNYEMLRQSLQDSIEGQDKDLAEAKAAKASAFEAKAAAESDLGVTKSSLQSTEDALADLTRACTTAASDHEASEKSRAEELTALASAKQALLDKTGAAEGVAYSSLLQLEHTSAAGTDFRLESAADLANFEVVNVVRQLAKRTHSAEIAQLASRISSLMQRGTAEGQQDPFAKVKGLIRGLLEKLQKEAGADADHKAYCDKEMAMTKEKLDMLNRHINKLAAKSDSQKARSRTLKGEVGELQRELAEIASSQAKMTKIRADEHAAFVQAKDDLEQGLEGVRLALKILREHYSGASLAQQPAAPTYHTESAGSATGILGMLEVIESDLGKTLAEAQMQEETAAAAYDKVTQANAVSTTSKDQDVKYKSEEALGLGKSVGELSVDLESARTELDAVLDYNKSIREQCVAKPETYDERRAQRQAEIDGLKEALSILENQAAFLQGRNRGLRGARVRPHV